MQRSVCCIDRLNPPPKAATRRCLALGWRRRRSGSEVGVVDGVGAGQLDRRPAGDDTAALEDVATIGDGQGLAHVLLDQQNGGSGVDDSARDASSWSTMRGARPSDGSSRRRSRGADIMARATATICCSPPLIVPASCPARSARCGKSRSTRARRCPRSPRATSQPPSSRFSATVICPNSCRPSATSATPRRTTSLGCSAGSVSPSRSMRPRRGSRPAIAFSSVVFPAPFGPSTTVRPGSMQVDVSHDEKAAVAGD